MKYIFFLAVLLAGCGAGIDEPPQPRSLLITGDSHALLWEREGLTLDGWRVTFKHKDGGMSHQIAATFNPEGYDRILILVGTNDVVNLGPDTPTTSVAGMAIKSPAAVILFRIPPFLNPVDPHDPSPWNAKIDAMGYRTLDGYAVGMNGGMGPDGKHFSADGYKQLAARLRTLLE